MRTLKKIFSKIENKGFTLVELGVAITVLATLFGIATVSLGSFQQKASIDSAVQTIVTDLKEQQVKAMIGDTEGRPSASAYGIHFEENQYMLFNGAIYSSSDPTNFAVEVPSNLQITTPLDVIFSQRSGELGGTAVITIANVTNNDQKTIELNRYGVVTGVN